MRIKCENCDVSHDHWEGHRCKEVMPDEHRPPEHKSAPPVISSGVCPTCGQTIKPKALTNAERQRRHRERKKAE